MTASLAIDSKLTQFEESLLLSLIAIITKQGDEINKQTDLLDPHVQSLHRLYLSYLREYRNLREKIKPAATPAIPPAPTQRSSSTKKKSIPEVTPAAASNSNRPSTDRSKELLLDLIQKAPGLLKSPVEPKTNLEPLGKQVEARQGQPGLPPLSSSTLPGNPNPSRYAPASP